MSVSTQTGAFQYTFPIVVPPGRLGVQPNLALSYSSQGANYGGIAAGWSLSIPEIKVDTSQSLVKGQLDDVPFGEGPYISTMAGHSRLVQVSEPALTDVNATFRAQSDGTFARYERMNAGSTFNWRVRTPDGRTYYFGDTTLAPASSWVWSPLTRIEDSFHNTIEYEWDGFDISEVRYTSNPAAGLPAFARVEFDWGGAPICSLIGPVGSQQDKVLGATWGARQLNKIRAIAQLPGAAVEHTREITLMYSSAHASCNAKHGPMRVLESIQESAWGPAAPRVDLPAVTFEYGRFQRSFDELLTLSSIPWASYPYDDNLGWGTRSASYWPTVQAMFLDFDGDGLQDRLFASNPSTNGTCAFSWRKNLGRGADGRVHFGAETETTLPRLPWASSDDTIDPSRESCSLSAQLTTLTTTNDVTNANCPETSGTYLAYRWLDMTGDGLPDLVTALHHDPNFFDPNKDKWFGEWPQCESETPPCAGMSSSCMSEVAQCAGSDVACTFEYQIALDCLAQGEPVECGALARQSTGTQISDCESHVGSDIDPNWCEATIPDYGDWDQNPQESDCPDLCEGTDRLSPPDYGGSGADCNQHVPHKACSRYPWMIYENLGGRLAAEPQIEYQPIPLESDVGDSSFGGDNLSSTRHAVIDIDGDGNLDAVVRGRYTEQDLDIDYNAQWWLVFPGDGNGRFETSPSGGPYIWMVPESAPVSGSCTSFPGFQCSVLERDPFTRAEDDVRGLSTLIDLNGDGALDLVWKLAPDQFEPNPNASFLTWKAVGEDDPILYFNGTGRNFEYLGLSQHPEGTPLAWGGLAYFSRSHVVASSHLGSFMSEGRRTSMARFLDIDADGRPDVLESGFNGTSWDTNPTLFINGGGMMLPGLPLSGEYATPLRQSSRADVTAFNYPHNLGWFVKEELLDLDGDGLVESWHFEDDGKLRVRRDADPQPLRLMQRIRNGRGGTVDVRYAPTTDSAVVTQDATFDSPGERHAMPHTQWVAKSLSVNDEWDPDVSTATYHYTNPVWKADDQDHWGFRGFETVTTTSPSGSTRVDRYGFDVDWSGRLKTSLVYEEGDTLHPRTISETTWQERSLFGGSVKTYHPIAERKYTCSNTQTEADCRVANSGLVQILTIWVPLSSSSAPGGPHLLHYPSQVYTMDSILYGQGDRHRWDGGYLYADTDDYRLVRKELADLEESNGAGQEAYTNYEYWVFDPSYRVALEHHKFFELGLIGWNTRAITSSQFDMQTGVRVWTRAPRNQGSGPVESYAYDSTKRFVTNTVNELGQIVVREYDWGTGAVVSERGPSSSPCGSGCINHEQTWTDVDGLGRPIAAWVNREVPGNPTWVKTQVSWISYVDSVVSGARTRLITETLIDYATSRHTHEETLLDGQGRPVEIRVATGDAIDAVTSYEYDHEGHLVEVTVPDPSQNTAATVMYSYRYDSLGRPTSIRRPAVGGGNESGVDLSYDGLIHRRQEEAGSLVGPEATTELHHDAFGRLLKVRESIDGSTFATTNYQYDARDAVRRIENPDGVVTQLFHDFGGRRTRIVRAGRTWTYGYNASGDMVSEAAPSPPGLEAEYITTFAHDVLGRESTRSVPSRGLPQADLDLLGIGTLEFEYDNCKNGVARLCDVTHPNDVLTTAFEYDAEGNEAAKTHEFTFAGVTGKRVSSASFGPGGRLVSQTLADHSVGQNDGTQSTFVYDDRALAQTVHWIRPGVGPTTIAVQTRNVAGLVTRRATSLDQSGWHEMASDWAYDPLTRVTLQAVSEDTGAGWSQLARQQISYFGQDDPSRLQHWLGSQYYDFGFEYDPRHQLTSAQEAGGRLDATYSFTQGGKFDHVAVHAASPLPPGADLTDRDVTYEYASPDDPEAVSALARSSGGNLREYTYDTVGSMVERRDGGKTDSFVYDGQDQFRRLTSSDGTEEYFYDHAGQRIAVVSRDQSGAVETVRYFHGDAEVLFDASSSLVKAHAHISLGTPVARVTSHSDLELVYHGLSSNTLISVAPDGEIKSGFVYAPYGELLESTGPDQAEQHRRFNDKYQDDLTKLSYYGVRYFDGLLLGWTQADPLFRFAPDAAWDSPRYSNLYTFSLNNPLRYLDPDGFAPGGGPPGANIGQSTIMNSGPQADTMDDVVTGIQIGGYATTLVIIGIYCPGCALMIAMAPAKDHGDTAVPIMSFGCGTSCKPGRGPAVADDVVDDVVGAGARTPPPVLGPKTAEQAANEALAAGKPTGAAAELTIPLSDEVFTGVSGNSGIPPTPQTTGLLMSVPKEARSRVQPWFGSCAEMSCLDQAFAKGINPYGGTMRAVNIGSSGGGHGTPKEICPACANILSWLGIHH